MRAHLRAPLEALDPLAPNPVLLAASEQHTERSIGVEDRTGLHHPHRHQLAILLGDLLESRRAIERAGRGLLNREPRGSALGEQIDHGSEPIRPILLPESTPQPHAAIGPADARALGVDRAAALLANVPARHAAELSNLGDAEHDAAERALAASALGSLFGSGRTTHAPSIVDVHAAPDLCSRGLEARKRMLEIDAGNRSTILIHYYRAMVGRADIWRTRMDTTTNWAIGATAAIMSFTLGNASVPHYVVVIAALMTTSFLALEARRLTFYHLWQGRVLLLEDGLIRAALNRPPAASTLGSEHAEVDLPAALDAQLGRTVPTMPRAKAIARRLRRIYLYLFGVQLLAWWLKLASHPTPAPSFAEMVQRAHVGPLPGALVLTLATTCFAAAWIFALTKGGTDRDPA